MEQPAPPSAQAPAAPSASKRFGRALGKELKLLKSTLSRRTESQADATAPASGTVGRKYEEVTGRDSRRDGNIAGTVGLALAAVVGGTMVLAAASHVVITGAIVALGVAGVAGCCKVTGHDQEYNAIVGASTTAVTTVVSTTRDFAGGVMEAVGDGAPDGEAAARPEVDASAPDASGAAPGTAAPASQPPSSGAAASSPLPPYISVTQQTSGLYPTVHAPVPPSAPADLINFDESAPRK